MIVVVRNMLLVGILLLGIVGVSFAQDDSVMSHCEDTTQSPVPLSDVEFGGIIFMSGEEGTRALRNPIETPYFIAFSDHYQNFGSMGSLSPDGKWFTYPSGHTVYANMLAVHYIYEAQHFIDTYTGQKVFSVPRDGSELFVGGSDFIYPPLFTEGWVDNTRYILDDQTIIDTNTQTAQTITEPLLFGVPLRDSTDLIITREIVQVEAPAGRRTQTNVVEIETGEKIAQTIDKLQWLGDGTGYYIQSEILEVFNLDGSLRASYPINRGIRPSISHTGKWLAWMDRAQLHVMNIETEEVVNLCLNYRMLVFSPDETQAIVLVADNVTHIGDQELWLVDLKTFETTLLAPTFHYSNVLLGWWDLQD
jgi:hypothetical protein